MTSQTFTPHMYIKWSHVNTSTGTTSSVNIITIALTTKSYSVSGSYKIGRCLDLINHITWMGHATCTDSWWGQVTWYSLHKGCDLMHLTANSNKQTVTTSAVMVQPHSYKDLLSVGIKVKSSGPTCSILYSFIDMLRRVRVTKMDFGGKV